MAKRKINKSQKVRNYLAKHPDAKPTEAAQALKRYKVSPAYVSNVKTMLKRGNSNKGARGRRRGSGRGRSGDEQIVAAAQLIGTCGGIEQARQALRAAARVADMLG